MQEGETGAICFGDTTGYIRKVGKDEEGLGCWRVMTVESMLGTINNMKFFLMMGFGDSTNFAGGGISIKTQGMCQGMAGKTC